MPKVLVRKNPAAFKTLPLFVEATPESLSYQSLGTPLNFTQMLERRRPVAVNDSNRFGLELANLGVSIRLTLRWQGRDYWVLVRQQRHDRGDVVLKLLSGYVPAHELNLPLFTAVQEIAEECLLETPEGWLTGRFGNIWLSTPYTDLHYREAAPFRLHARSGAARPVYCGATPLVERPRAYVHLPTASLQLVYDMYMELPKGVQNLSLFHVDERVEEGKLVASLERSRPDLYLIPLVQGLPCDELFTLRKGQLTPASTRGLWLAESFAPQEGWVVRDERISWKDWLAHRPNGRPKATLTRLTPRPNLDSTAITSASVLEIAAQPA
ncbi:hypothetical protein LX59_01010 [Azomonas agilis]|uniref:Metal ABC transporter ATPase n=1 Tax=Azomonas agilis TaxID=116849 RepID=A0A562IYH5_9GAMM|nr:metal ABC transporter ATPase [Azomonas agilis]TWH76091.1 hypothetical protein LX59_01010 [Azomonas agilis]